jgi:tetratricopeptide (TPR) repeat protein
MPYQERQRREIRWVDSIRDRERFGADVWSGTIFAGPISVAPKLWWDRPWFRSTPPAARFGNLFVFRGTFPSRTIRAPLLYFAAKDYIYTSKPDLQSARKLLVESVALDPKAFFVSIELGNVETRLGERDGAIAAYETARKYAPAQQEAEAIARQIARISTEPLESISPLRNPELE